MKLRHLFTINFPIAVFFGLTCTLLPSLVLKMYGLPVDDAAVWVTRLVGGSILGFSTLMWFGRKTDSTDFRRSIARALLVQDIVGFIASMEIQLRGNINVLGWSNPILYGALTFGYAYFLFMHPKNS